MGDYEIKAEVEVLKEKITTVSNKADAVHGRIDKHETIVREDLASMKQDMKDVAKIVTSISAWVNEKKGWDRAMMFVAGALGSGITAVLNLIFK